MRCKRCGSRRLEVNKYVAWCKKCGADTILLPPKPLDEQPAEPTPTVSWVGKHIYVLIALMFIVGFILAKVTA